MGARVLDTEHLTLGTKISGTVTAATGGGTAYAGLNGMLNEHAVVIGIVCSIIGAACAIGGLVASIYFKRLERRDRLLRNWQDMED